MRGSVACRLLLPALVAAAACHRGPSAAVRQQEVTTCSAISVDTIGTVECLVRLHNWKPEEARLAAHNRQLVMDSTRARQEDSAWTLDAAAHRRDIEQCRGQDLVQCLTFAGWTDEHAQHAADSVWNRNAPQHARELADCARRSRGNPASCLMLSYRWGEDRAQAAGDSIMRARMAAH